MMTKETNIPVKKYYFNVEEYHLMGEVGILGSETRVELINGEVIEMDPVKSPHSGTVMLLNRLLGKKLGDDFIISIHHPVELNRNSEPEPDLMILNHREDFFTKSHPQPADVILLIEVADSTLEKDRKIKLPLYAAAGITETWIVNLQDQQIEVSTEPSEKGYSNCHIYRKGDTILHELLEEVAVSEVLVAGD